MHFLGQKHQHEHDPANKNEPQTDYTRFLDRLTLIAGLIGPFTVLPQIYQIFSTKSAAGVSPLTWGLIFVVTFPWILYGLARKDKTIMISFTLWEIVNATVFIGAIMYH